VSLRLSTTDPTSPSITMHQIEATIALQSTQRHPFLLPYPVGIFSLTREVRGPLQGARRSPVVHTRARQPVRLALIRIVFYYLYIAFCLYELQLQQSK
jgi:hypothetical protein